MPSLYYYYAPRKRRCKRRTCTARSRELGFEFLCTRPLLLPQPSASFPKMATAQAAPCHTAGGRRAKRPLDPCGGLESYAGAPRGPFRARYLAGGHRVWPGGRVWHQPCHARSRHRRLRQVCSCSPTCTQATPPQCDVRGSDGFKCKQLRRTEPASAALSMDGALAKSECRRVSKALQASS